MLSRSRALLAALWAGMLLAVAFVAAPSAFAALDRAQAGLVVAQLFEKEAAISLGAALLLMLMDRRLVHGIGSNALSAGFLLPAGAMFCTVAGYYALQPMMAAAKSGQGPWPFMALHAISLGFFGLKGLLVLLLAWRSGKH
ncbi:DUF4149 domain-containing protein [Roseateles koreensis]|uniref:DUF4149 domain-containing protein n=1 Tax=Roseateles koreensis TaxID=2987526 RepID=A0ABT5KNA9_9BURK|nr:DUF4149 domain-containing protein [Roseateles koreensis]MDC8784409.1 DUF4149 domain-containing protein [Roseateles koreensis]